MVRQRAARYFSEPTRIAAGFLIQIVKETLVVTCCGTMSLVYSGAGIRIEVGASL
jgi:hypothetical protein